MPKRILIICYSFPPFPGIGGRRWAKFAKYFKKNGNNVFVIACKNPFAEKSQWIKDIDNINVSYLHPVYPKALTLSKSNGLIDKVLYRLSLLYVRLLGKGNYYDRTLFWKYQLIKKVEFLIKKYQINNVIVSVAPFHNAYHISQLISKYPNVNFVVDFRDPWINNKTAYGYGSLSLKRKNFEKKMEEQVIRLFNKVISVSSVMNDYFIKTYNLSPQKFITIPNGYDSEDLPAFIDVGADEKKRYKFAFTGSFYEKASYILELLAAQLDKLKIENFSLYTKLSFEFIGDCTFDNSFIVKNHPIVKFFKKGNQNQSYQLIQNVNYCMLFLTDDINYSFSTKFCEYIALKKPVVVFAKGGQTGKFVMDNNIGFHVDADSFDKDFNRLLEKIVADQLTFSPSFDLSNFDIVKLTNIYENILV